MRTGPTVAVLVTAFFGMACGTLPNRMTPLDPASSPVTKPLEGTCVEVGVVDPRDDRSIYLMGAFNILRIDGTDYLSFVRSQFEASARSRGACQIGFVKTASVSVSIRDLVFDSAWGWPFTAHQCRVALDVVAAKGPSSILRELQLRRAARLAFPTDPRVGKLENLWNVPHCLSAQVRELAESFYEDAQVQELLTQEE